MLKNLEPICAQCGHDMIDEPANAQEQENIITNALGVLAENGLYAMSVYLLSCNKADYGARVLTRHLKALWQREELGLLPPNGMNSAAEVLGGVRAIAEDLPKLIFCRKVTEQAMIFARYHAKAYNKQ